MPPLASLLIGLLGWRGAYLALGALAVALGGGLALLIENDPRHRGLGPDGDPPQSTAPMAQPEGATVREAIRSTRFISLYAACLICAFGVFVPFVHVVPYARDHGIAPSSAVLLLAVIGVGSTAGRFFLGGLAGLVGILYTSVAFGTLIGPSAAGFAFDFSHSYTLPILLSAGASTAAAVIVAAASARGSPQHGER